MPKVNFPDVPDAQNFSPLPEGKYLCKIIEIDETTTRNDDEMWKLHFKVIKGESRGRHLIDNLVFSKAAMGRVKLICSRLGLDTSQEIDVMPKLLLERKCYLMVEIQDYINDKGQNRKRNVIPFSGYEIYEDADVDQDESDISEREIEEEDELPF